MKRPESPDLLPVEVEEHLTHLLERWAHDQQLPAASARRMLEAVQERDAWDQRFWTRLGTVLTRTTAVVRPVPSRSWGLALPIETDLVWGAARGGFDGPGFCSYLCLGA